MVDNVADQIRGEEYCIVLEGPYAVSDGSGCLRVSAGGNPWD